MAYYTFSDMSSQDLETLSVSPVFLSNSFTLPLRLSLSFSLSLSHPFFLFICLYIPLSLSGDLSLSLLFSLALSLAYSLTFLAPPPLTHPVPSRPGERASFREQQNNRSSRGSPAVGLPAGRGHRRKLSSSN